MPLYFLLMLSLHSLFFLVLLVPTRSLLSFYKVIMNIGRLTEELHLIRFAQGKNLPHGVHVCYSSSNFLIEIETQFISFRFYLWAHVNETFCMVVHMSEKRSGWTVDLTFSEMSVHFAGSLHCIERDPTFNWHDEVSMCKSLNRY